jgi:hypothetical protein
VKAKTIGYASAFLALGGLGALTLDRTDPNERALDQANAERIAQNFVQKRCSEMDVTLTYDEVETFPTGHTRPIGAYVFACDRYVGTWGRASNNLRGAFHVNLGGNGTS